MTNDYGTEAVAVHHDSHSKTYQATKQRRSAPCRAACAGSDVCGTTKRTAKGRRAAPRKSVVRIPERHCFIHTWESRAFDITLESELNSANYMRRPKPDETGVYRGSEEHGRMGEPASLRHQLGDAVYGREASTHHGDSSALAGRGSDADAEQRGHSNLR